MSARKLAESEALCRATGCAYYCYWLLHFCDIYCKCSRIPDKRPPDKRPPDKRPPSWYLAW